MQLFLDTEFTNFQSPELISVGLVSADRRYEFYGEFTDFRLASCSEFVIETVLPLLNREASAVRGTKRSVANALERWLRKLPRSIISIAADYPSDLTLAGDLLNGFTRFEQSKEVNYELLKLTPHQVEMIDEYYWLHGVPRHHALEDARALRRAVCRAR